MLNQYSETYVPIYHEFVEITKEHEELHWHEGEAKLKQDVEQWKTGMIIDEEKELIKNILMLFTQSDVNVGRDYIDNLLPVMKNNEVRNMLTSFAGREGTHQRAYALLNDTLGFPEASYKTFMNVESMMKKHEFMIEMSNKSHHDTAVSIAKQGLIEGVSLFSMFAMLLNFQRQGKLPGMGSINEWSIRDEGLHCKGLALLFKTHLAEHPRIVNDGLKKEIYDSARKIVELESAFIDTAFENTNGKIIGIDAESTKQYVKYVTDYRMRQFGLKRQFGVMENPFPWLDWVTSSSSHGNFFETDITNYSKNNMVGSFDSAYDAFKSNDDQFKDVA